MAMNEQTQFGGWDLQVRATPQFGGWENRRKLGGTPQFGGWDQRAGRGKMAPNYSLVFSRVRANRIENKNSVQPRSYDSEKELIMPHYDQRKQKRRTLMRFLSCCTLPETRM